MPKASQSHFLSSLAGTALSLLVGCHHSSSFLRLVVLVLTRRRILLYPSIVDVTSLFPPHPSISTVTSSDPTALQCDSLRKGQTIYYLAVTVSSEGYQMAYWPGVAKRTCKDGTELNCSPNGVDTLLLVRLGASYHR